MVAPGFDYEDFELFSQAELIKQYPEQKRIIMDMAYKVNKRLGFFLTSYFLVVAVFIFFYNLQ